MTAVELMTLAGQSHEALPIQIKEGRTSLCRWFAEFGFKRGAEIGVWEGGFAEKICQHNPGVALTCVDPWMTQTDYKEGKNDPARMAQAYRTARERLAPFNCTFLKMTSYEASTHVEDGSLDFIYLDGNHLFSHVLQDLQLWVPKVRSGGIIAGHDYGARKKDKTFIQVQAAVDHYTRERAIDPWFVLTGDKSASFMWMVS